MNNKCEAVPVRSGSKATFDKYYMREHVKALSSQWIRDIWSMMSFIPTREEDACAGNGEIAKYFPNMHLFDLYPDPLPGVTVTKRDWFEHTQQYEPGLFLYMNTPYGVNSRLAVEFINHGAPFAEYISAVVPRTWSKTGNNLIRSIDKRLEVVAMMNLPENSFYVPDNNNKVHDVPSTIIMFRRIPTRRFDAPKPKATNYLVMQNGTDKALAKGDPDIALLRTGDGAGKLIMSGFDQYNKQQLLNIYADGCDSKILLDLVKSTDWSLYGNNMGQRGINKTEVITALGHTI